MSDNVNHPEHYTHERFTCECIDITRNMSFDAGNAVKYLWRHEHKNDSGPREDIEKAGWYLRDVIDSRVGVYLPLRIHVARGLANTHVIPHLDLEIEIHESRQLLDWAMKAIIDNAPDRALAYVESWLNGG